MDVKLNDFNYAKVQAKLLYDLELPDDIFEELGLIAWGLIGNKNVVTYRVKIDTDCKNKVELPCSVDVIKSVKDINGNYINFEVLEDNIILEYATPSIFIEYKSVILDDNGLPKINDKEALAIATYVAYANKFKLAISTNNGNLLKASSYLKKEWLRKCDAARVPISLTENFIDKILDIEYSWGRKVYNKPMKNF